ncbi:MAG: flagellar regulator YcgR PilZN domain-containing protein [Pseudomonadales bacterium]
MISSLLERYKSLRGNKPVNGGKPKEDAVLNYIYLHLHQALRNRSFVEVLVNGDDVLYQSMILWLDPEERTILIDELFPTGLIGLSGQKVQVSIRQQAGRKLKFNSVIIEQHRYEGTPIYVLAMPEGLESDQRRNAYRLPISEKITIEPHFIGPDDQTYLARLRNLSSSGIAMEVEVDDVNGFGYDDQLTHLAFDFAGINIDCGLAVRNVEFTEPAANRVLIGAEFVDLPPPDQRVLEKSIMRIQRDRIRLTGEMESQLVMM